MQVNRIKNKAADQSINYQFFPKRTGEYKNERREVKELKRIVELMQKSFSMSALVDTVENTEANEGLKTLMATTRDIVKDFDNPSYDQIRDLFESHMNTRKSR